MQAKLKPVKQKVIAILTVLVMLAAALSYLSFPAFAGEAEAATTEPFQKEAVEISNGEFDQTSGSSPYEPSNWTAAALGDTLEGVTVDGVVDLTPAEINQEKVLKDLKLDIYDEFGGGKFPQTPFGKSVAENASQLYFPSTNSKALMINSNGSRVAYGYKSSSVSLTANSYYKISAWVKTGEFDNSGASLMVDGLKNPLIFRNIETDPALNNDKDKNYGWVEYNFFIETSSMMDTSVTLSLQLGDAYTYTDANGNTHSELHTASGYAFFDHITAYKLAPDEFLANTANIENTEDFLYPDKEDRSYSLSADGTQMYYSENEAEYLCIDDNGNVAGSEYANFESEEVGSFDNGSVGWSAAEESSGNFQYGIYDSPNDELGIKNDAPYSPNGTGDRIALVTTYKPAPNENKVYAKANVGIVTDYFTVERFVNYRLSVWVKTENGAVASAAVTGYDYRGGNPDLGKYGEPQLRKVTELTEGDAENKARNGWKEVAFYIKGSSFAAYDVRLELRLGRMADDGTTEDAAGVAMFDNVRIERITSKEYTDYSGGGTSVTFDPDTASSSITNNDFNNIETYDEYIEPFKPSGWTLMSAGEDSTTGMSTHKVNADYKDYVVSGVIASDATSYKYRKPEGEQYIEGRVTTHKQTEANGVPSNLLMIKSDESTGLPSDQRNIGGVAVGYRSSSFSISSESVQRVDVTLLADDIEGYGASLVLKNATNVIASVERIKSTGNKYETYSFYVQTGTSDLSEVYLEVWMGLYDRVNNTNKLAYGTLFVEDVSLTNMSAAESSGEDGDESAKQQALESARNIYAAKANEYHAKRAGAPTNFAVYSSLTEDFSAFDYYQENDFVRIPYSWSIGSVASYNGNSALKYGIFDAGEESPAGYEHNADNRYTMLVHNVTPAATRVKSTINYALASGSYYTIRVVAKVEIPTDQKTDRPNYKGAYIGIADTDHKISDIKSTTTVTDIYNPDSDVEGEYKTFTFYIKTAGELATDDDTDSSNTSDTIVTMEMGIGGTGSNEEWAVGTMYVNSITVSQSSNVDFEEAQAKLEKGGALQGKYGVIADYSDKKDDQGDDDDNDDNSNITGDNWYVYTTVLLAVVLIVVLIAVAVRYYGIKRKRDAAGNADAPSYDREKTLVRQHNKRAEEAGAIRDKQLDAYEAFDEYEEDLIEEEQMRRLEAEELALLDAAETEESKTAEPDAETDTADESPAETESDSTDATINAEPEVTASQPEVTETTETAAPDEEEADENIYDQIVDFTPSEEKKKELEAKKAAEERAKAEKEAAEKKAAEERAKAEAEKKAANRRHNNWDGFDD